MQRFCVGNSSSFGGLCDGQGQQGDIKSYLVRKFLRNCNAHRGRTDIIANNVKRKIKEKGLRRELTSHPQNPEEIARLLCGTKKEIGRKAAEKSARAVRIGGEGLPKRKTATSTSIIIPTPPTPTTIYLSTCSSFSVPESCLQIQHTNRKHSQRTSSHYIPQQSPCLSSSAVPPSCPRQRRLLPQRPKSR